MLKDKKIIALCTSRIYDAQIHKFISEFNEELRRNNMYLLIFTLNSDLYWNEREFHPEKYVYDIIPYNILDAVVIMDEKIKSREVSEKIIAEAKKFSVPVAIIDGSYEDTASISFDYSRGLERMIEHIIKDHNVRRPHFMAGIEGNKFSEERTEVFKKVIAENNIPLTEDMISYGGFWAGPSREAANAIIDRGDLPEAIICANDIMAINVCDVLTSRGIKVPEQVIVSGFDGIYEGKLFMPRISTVNCSSTAMAKAAADMLIKYMDNKKCGIYSVIPELDLNESCGCCGKDSDHTEIDCFNDGFYRYQDDIRLYYESTVKMQQCTDIEAAADILRSHIKYKRSLFFNLCCVIDSACLDVENVFFLSDSYYPNSKNRMILCDSYSDINKLTPLGENELVPDMDNLLNNGYPLIFNAIDYMNKPIGYICYYFGSYDITDYSKTASMANTIGMGLGGFINMRHQKYLSDQVENMYKTDSLTGLYNRTGFKTEFEKARLVYHNTDTQLTFIMADLDGLKIINDGFGHDAGDKAIAAAAQALKKACPAGRSLCTRYGGDELLALIFGECDPDEMTSAVEKLLKEFNDNSGLEYKVSASCGAYSVIMNDSFNFEDTFRFADEQMYITKRNKKNRRK